MDIKVKTIHSHPSDRSFVMIVERQGRGQYMICVDNLLGTPRHVSSIDGVVIVYYEYIGYGVCNQKVFAKSKGKLDWTLDPICEALIRKGWSQRLIRMHFLKYEPMWNVISDWAFRPINSKWDDSKEKYIIAQEPTFKQSSYGPDWAILVNLDDNNYIAVHVTVPEVYENSGQLTKLLKAINSLPDAKLMPDIHPAMLATV